MSKNIVQITLFASGTTETKSERSALRIVAGELNKQLEKTHAITLRIRSWPEDFRPGVNLYSQAELNHQLGKDFDIYLGVLGSRFGASTPKAGSGTEEEFNLALDKIKENSRSVRLLFYFKKSADDLFSVDMEQLAKVRRFRDALGDSGVLYRDFSDTADFVQQTREHIYALIVEEWSDEGWTRIDLLDESTSSKESLSDTTRSNVTASIQTDIAKNLPALTHFGPDEDLSDENSSDDLDLGFLEYMENFQSAVPAFADSVGQMSKLTSEMNERIRQRTEETNAVQEEITRLDGVGGSRERQTQVKCARRVVDAAADDLNKYANDMEGALGQYRTHSRAMFNNLGFAVQDGGELWTDETKEEFRSSIKTMIETLESTLNHIKEFQASIRRMLALTKRFKQARNRTAGILGELIAETTFSKTESEKILAKFELNWTPASSTDSEASSDIVNKKSNSDVGS